MKWVGKNKRIKSEEIEHFFGIHDRITNKDFLQKHANENIQDLFSNLKKNCSFRYFFITNDSITDNHKDEFSLYEEDAKEKYKELYNNDLISWERKFKNDLNDEYKRVKTLGLSPPQEVRIPIEKMKDETKNWAYLDISKLMEHENYKTVIFTIRGTTLKNLYSDSNHRESLFNYNIRGYLGLNQINRKIKKTIDDNPEHFYYFNNGISAICTQFDFNLKGNQCEIICNDLQIINGAQTVTCIGMYKDDEKLQKVRVLVRLTKGENTKSEKGFNKDIIMYNNSQNIIKMADFRSNDNVQVDIEKKFKENKIIYSGDKPPHKKIVYQRKRRDKKKCKSNELWVDMNELAKAICAYQYGPQIFLTSTKTLFNADTDEGSAGYYYKIFGGDDEEEISGITEYRFKEIASIMLIWKSIEDECLRRKKDLESDDIGNLVVQAKWFILWCFGESIRKLMPVNGKKNSSDKLYVKIIKGYFFGKDNTDSVFKEWFSEVYQFTKEAIEYARESKDFNFRNWLRFAKGKNHIQKKLSDIDYLKKHFVKPYNDFFKEII